MKFIRLHEHNSEDSCLGLQINYCVQLYKKKILMNLNLKCVVILFVDK